jgi:hypothetical protein
MSQSKLESRFAHLWAARYPEIDLSSEYKFHPDRKYRLDFAHLPSQVGIEIQGGLFMAKSGHSSIHGMLRDCRKTLLAASVGWLIVPLVAPQLDDGETLSLLAEVIRGRSSP